MNKLSKLTALLLALVLALSLPMQVMAESAEIETKTEYYEVADQILQKMIMAYEKYGEYRELIDVIEAEHYGEFWAGLADVDRQELSEYIVKMFWAACISVTTVAPLKPAVDISNMLPAARLMQMTREGSTGDSDGLVLNKNVTPQTGVNAGKYTITLDAYVTGEVTKIENYTPADVVLVLDVSGSMNTYFDGERYERRDRLEALQDAVCEFVDSINTENIEKKTNHRISIVKFSTGASVVQDWAVVSNENVQSIKNKVNALDHNGGTEIHLGMQEAYNQLYVPANYQTNLPAGDAERSQVVVVFTDGQPAWYSFAGTFAAQAINTARQIKEKGATVYSVAIYPEASPRTNPVWTNLKNQNDVTRINAICHAISSNYEDASAEGTGDGGKATNNSNAADGTLTITPRDPNSDAKPFETNGKTYYLTASSKDDLNTIFDAVTSSMTGGASMELEQTTVVRDIVAPSFSMPASATNVIAWTEECTSYNETTGAATFTAETPSATESGLTVTIDNTTNAIDVSGFDFAGNFVSQNGYTKGDPEKEGTYHGSRLVIQFDVAIKPGFLGGNNVKTNGDTSGVYSEGTMVEAFTVPQVNVPIQNLSVSAVPKHIYVSNNLSANDMIVGAAITDYYGTAYQLDPEKENFGLAAWQVEYVNLSVVPQTAVAQPVTQDSSYSITCTVTPKESADEKSIGDEVEDKSVNTSAAIYVYTPEVTFQDSVEKYMDPVTADDAYYTGYNIPENNIAWVHPTYGVAADTNSPMTGTEPALTFNYTAANWRNEANQVSATADVPVTVTTTALGTGAGTAGMPLSGKQIKYTRIKCDECSSNAEVAGKCELVIDGVEKIEDAADGTDIVPTFVIHVYDVHGKLAISKTVENASGSLKDASGAAYAPDAAQKFTFNVTLKDANGDAVTGDFKTNLNGSEGTVTFNNEGVATVELLHGQTITIEGITNGVAYTVTETKVVGFTPDKTEASGNIVANDTKTAAFTNTYNVGQLTVTKTVDNQSGMYDLSGDQFTFTVEFSDKTTRIGYTVNGTQGTTTNGVATFTLTKDQIATFDRIPAGVTYTVTENTNFQMAGYTKGTETNTSGKIAVNQTSAAVVENIYNTGTLTISKTGMDAGEYAVFNATVVARGVEQTITVVVPNGGSAVIKGLDLGSAYKVTEVGDWTWRYTSEVTSDSGNGKIPTESDYKAEVSFKNSKNNEQWIDGNTYAENKFDAYTETN